jgi:hypothetical protein
LSQVHTNYTLDNLPESLSPSYISLFDRKFKYHGIQTLQLNNVATTHIEFGNSENDQFLSHQTLNQSIISIQNLENQLSTIEPASLLHFNLIVEIVLQLILYIQYVYIALITLFLLLINNPNQISMKLVPSE